MCVWVGVCVWLFVLFNFPCTWLAFALSHLRNLHESLHILLCKNTLLSLDSGHFRSTQLQNDRRPRHLPTKHEILHFSLPLALVLLILPSLFFSSFFSFYFQREHKVFNQNQNATQNLFLLPHWNILLYFSTFLEEKIPKNQMKQKMHMQFIDQIICMVNNEWRWWWQSSFIVFVCVYSLLQQYIAHYMHKNRKLNFELLYSWSMWATSLH